MYVFPERPADLSAQTDAQLDALMAACRESIEAASLAENVAPYLAQIRSTNELFCACRDLKAERNQAAGGAQAELEDILRNVGLGEGDGEGEAAPAEGEGEAAPEEEGTPDTDENGEPITIVHEEEASDKPAIPAFRRRSAPKLAAIDSAAPKTKVAPRVKASSMVAAAPVAGLAIGENFTDLRHVATALAERWSQVGDVNTGERFPVMRIDANFNEEDVLTQNDVVNYAKMGGGREVEDLQAAICAPREPIYDLGCPSSTRRPVWNSLRKYKAPRGGVTIYPSPKLADVKDANGVGFNANDGSNRGMAGTGIWTRTNDANPSATKNACAVIPCNDSVNYDIYGIYRCMTIKNMNAMTFPELVEAFMNRLGALHARLGDVSLLNGMKGTVNVLDLTTSVPYGASIGVLETLLRTISFYKEQERYDDVQFDMWAPRQFRDMLIADQLMQRRTDGDITMADRVAAADTVNQALSGVGVDTTWTLDRADGWPTVDILTDGGTVPHWPTVMNTFISPKGNIRALDGGRMDIGVAPGNIYRDNVSNTKNQYTLFWETFEGIVDFGCTSLHMRFQDVCVGGAQPADCALICDGALS